ncbi:hypothetical protein ALC57_10396 [Trachymyrmex cornetzi]|uniref:Uncharacterized protein n=1 Tax=Trachymyrmex cornetzi TaxID=471704 RepID=A0A151J474_9HYME|nr:hypothetical protein ALC57_10396 [Trachymyrmex cornetzi]
MNRAESGKENDVSLANELFREQPIANESPWDPIIFESTKSKVKSGIKEELQESILSKFDLKGDLTCFGPPKLNNEIKLALSKHPSVLKRDEYQTKAQSQVAACLWLRDVRSYKSLSGSTYAAADSSAIDEWLFGASFAEGLKSAQACEKAGKDLSRFPSGPGVTAEAPY